MDIHKPNASELKHAKAGVARVAALLTVLGIGLANCSPTPPGSSTYEAREAVKASLNDPGSAQFEDLIPHTDSDPHVCGMVNAKNAFGGYVGFRRFIYDAKDLKIENVTEDPLFTPDWVRRCR